MDYESSKLFGLDDEKDFQMSQEKQDFIKRDPYFTKHKFKKVPLSKLIQDNDLDNPVSLSNRIDSWGKSINEYHYDSKQDNRPHDVIYGTQRNGKIRLANGRHRIRALANDGYRNVWIPILDEE